MPPVSIRPQASVPRFSRTPFANASAALGKLTPGCRVVGLTKGQFSLLDLIQAALAQTGPAEVLVSTWTQGKVEMQGIEKLLNSGRVTSFRLLVDRSFIARHPDHVRRIQKALGADVIRQTNTHAKFVLIAGGGYAITIRTSMNLNHNPRLEQFDLDDNPEIYAFFKSAVEELYRRVPAGLNVAASEIERGFANATLGGEMDEDWAEDAAVLSGLIDSLKDG